MGERTLTLRLQARYDVNCSILFQYLPIRERPFAARRAGFEAVEFWWPFDVAVPSDREVDGFVTAIQDAGVRLVSLNLFGGDLAAGERGILSWPGRSAEFEDNLEIAIEIGDRLGCRTFNALYGNRISGESAQAQDDLAAVQLARAAQAASRVAAQVVVEPISGIGAYPLKTAEDALLAATRAGEPNIKLLADLYHLAVNGDDVGAVIDAHAAHIGHVQIADAPGRGRPGSGDLPLADHIARLLDRGYAGWIGLEYVGEGPADFDWLLRADGAA